MASLLESLRELLEGSPPDPLRLDPAQRSWALRTGMAPLLCASLERDGGDLLEESAVRDWPELEAARIAAKMRSQEMRSTLVEVLRATTPHLGQPIVLLKGVATSTEIYPQPHLRPMRDLDLLLHDSDIAAFEEGLRSLGYSQQSHNPTDYYEAHHHVMPFLDTGRGVWVEPHTALFTTRDPISVSSVFAPPVWRGELRDLSIDGIPVASFSPEYQLLYTACHWSRNLDAMGSLPGLLDMSLLIRRRGEALDWSRFFDWLGDPLVRTATVPVLSFLKAEGLIDLQGHDAASLLEREVRKLGRASVSLQHGMIRRYCFAGAPAGRFLGENNRAVLWAALNRPGTPHSRLTGTFWDLLFPPTAPNRYSLRFQLSRLRSALATDRPE